MTSILRTTTLAAFAALLGAVPLQAQQHVARATPSITVSALNTTAAAEVAKQAAKAARSSVLPNDVLRYTLSFVNPTDKPVRNVELRDAIPAGVHYVAGSAHASRADARLEFSLDGGATWSAEPTETVIEEGKRVVRAASADRYTHVRWVITGAVAPKATVTADFEARVGGAGA